MRVYLVGLVNCSRLVVPKSLIMYYNFCLMLPNLWWDLLSLICTILLGIVAFADDVANSSPQYLLFLKNAVFKVLAVAFFGLMIWVSTQGKEANSAEEARANAKIARNERDSVNNSNLHRIDSMTHNQINSMNIGLAKVGLRLDTSKKDFGKLMQAVTDSTKSRGSSVQPRPEISIDSMYVFSSHGRDSIRFSIISYKAISENVRISMGGLIKRGEIFDPITIGEINGSLNTLLSNRYYHITFPIYNFKVDPRQLYYKINIIYKGGTTNYRSSEIYQGTSSKSVVRPIGYGVLLLKTQFKKYYPNL